MPADNSMLSTLLMLALMGLVFWFLLIRPAQRKQKAQQEMVSQIVPGTRIMTTAGIMGTVRHTGNAQAIIEIAPGVEMTILKQAIMRVVTESEEEFEYDDSDAPADAYDDLAPADTFDDPRPAGEPLDDSGFQRPSGDPADDSGFQRPADPDAKAN